MTGHGILTEESSSPRKSYKHVLAFAMFWLVACVTLWVTDFSLASVNSASSTETKNDMEAINGTTMLDLKEDSTPSLSSDSRERQKKSGRGGKEKGSGGKKGIKSLKQWMPGMEVVFEDVEEMPTTSKNADTISFLQDNFPECVLPMDSQGIINMTTMAAYRESSSLDPFGSTPSPRYDHVSCFVMKSRYNCAHPPSNSSQPKVATDYELVLNMNSKVKGGEADSPKSCRLGQLFDQKNPIHMPWLRPLHGGSDNGVEMLRLAGIKADSLGRYHILLQGNSFLRQVWEAITCGFRDHITELKVLGSHDLPPSGRIISNLEYIRRKGCHAGCRGKRADKLYSPEVPHPPCGLPHCNDDAAMVELDGTWRFYYIYRLLEHHPKQIQYIHEEMFDLAEPLQQSSHQANKNSSTPTSEDMYIEAAVVWNEGSGVNENVVPSIKKQGSNNNSTVGVGRHARVKPKRELGMSQILGSLRELQRNDVGHYFGADNPWIYTPPDGHPCMPGIPDDEVNLIMFSLLTGYQVSV